MQRLEHRDELVAQAVLEGDAVAVDPAGDEQHLFVLDVHALDRADAFGEHEHLRLGERRGGVPPAVAFPDHRRVEALLDRGPDRERRREVVAVDHEVGAVADADLVDGGEQVVGGVAGEHVGEARLDADADAARAGRPAPTDRRPRTGRRRASRRSPRTAARDGAARDASPCRGRCMPAANAPSKIGGLRRGSHALTTTSARISRASAATDSALDASTARGRESGRRRARRSPARARSASRSATVTCSKKSRRSAIAAIAAPTPPAPTTRMRIGRRLMSRIAADPSRPPWRRSWG